MAFVCEHCGSVSHNTNDLRNRFCGRCKIFDMTAVVINGKTFVLWGNVDGHAISACAPAGISEREIEAATNAAVKPTGSAWWITDIARFRPGPHTPSPCKHDPSRQHWFLISR